LAHLNGSYILPVKGLSALGLGLLKQSLT